MTDSRLFGRPLNVIAKSLDISARRHNLIAGNIANMDTIGYEPSDLDFQKTLQRAMADQPPDYLTKTDPLHLSPHGQEALSMNGSSSEEVDIYHLDSVNIDTEMMNLMANNIKYKTTAELLLRKMTMLNYAIDEGGK
jgi:flagellar basal-body rod protein FlgB